MDKLKMHSLNKVEDNISKIAELFPNVITETIKDGNVTRAIDFDILRQELSDTIVEGPQERYQFTWPDKKHTILQSNKPINNTLRPIRLESVSFEDTQNVYIKGDNLLVLKLLQETYLGKIKMIYIDPPYNTGSDFLYDDDFSKDKNEFLYESGQLDNNGNRMNINMDAGGRFHTNWLNMIYPRIKIAKNLLVNDGIMFISIDDNEASNLKKICDEIFGEINFIGAVTWEKRTKSQNTETARDQFQKKTEYIYIYKNSAEKMRFNLEVSGEKEYPYCDEFGSYREKLVEEMSSIGMRGRSTMIYPILGVMPREDKQWKVGIDQVQKYIDRNDVFVKDSKVFIKMRPIDEDGQRYVPFWSHFFEKDIYGTAETGKAELSELLGTKAHEFETVKPVSLIKKLLFHVKSTNGISLNNNDIVLDFFSGSATTAQAIMEMNAEDDGNRRFILVQYPQEIPVDSNPYNAGFRTICDIGLLRIRKVISKLKEKSNNKLDFGFRVLEVATSNMKNVYYNSTETEQNLLAGLVDNIKPERTVEDLIFQIMLDLGVSLSSKIEVIDLLGYKVFNIGENYLLACFDLNLNADLISEIAKFKPYYAVFRDSGFNSDGLVTNVEQIFNTYCPTTIRKVL